MRVGIDVRPLLATPKTGVGEYTYELLNALFALPTANEYFLFYNSYKDVTSRLPVWNYPNVHLVARRWPNKIFNALTRLRLIKLDRLCGGVDYWFSPNFCATGVSKTVKQILTVHDLSYEFYPEFFTWRQKMWHRILVSSQKQCERADFILAPSHNTARDIVERYHIAPEKVRAVYPGLSTAFSAPAAFGRVKVKKTYDLPDKFILYLGTVEPRKNIIGIIEAFEKVYLRLPFAYRLIIAGAAGWKNNAIYQKASTSPAREFIKFLGYVPENDKPALYECADLFVFPSFYEGFGLPVLEAMSAGVPVITSNRSSLPEVAGGAALLVNPRNSAELAEAMHAVLNDRAARERMVTNGRTRAEKFSWTQAARELLEIIK